MSCGTNSLEESKIKSYVFIATIEADTDGS